MIYLFIVIGTILYLAVLFFTSRKLGQIIWLIGLLIAPASMGTILAEVDIARGALSILTGSEISAMTIAYALAVGLLFASHWLAHCILKRSFRDLYMPGLLLLMLVGLFGWLGILRVELIASFLPDDIMAQSKYIFFIYPFISLTLGFALATTIRPIEAKLRRSKLSELILVARKNNLGIVRVSELVDKLQMSHDSVLDYVSEETDFYAKLMGEEEIMKQPAEEISDDQDINDQLNEYIVNGDIGETIDIVEPPERPLEVDQYISSLIEKGEDLPKPLPFVVAPIPIIKPRAMGRKLVTREIKNHKTKFTKEIQNPHREIRKTNRSVKNNANKKIVPK